MIELELCGLEYFLILSLSVCLVIFMVLIISFSKIIRDIRKSFEKEKSDKETKNIRSAVAKPKVEIEIEELIERAKKDLDNIKDKINDD